MGILIPSVKSEESNARKFIDYDKYKKIFYDNIYLDEFKIVVKMPLLCTDICQKEEIKIKKFNLEKYTFLLSY